MPVELEAADEGTYDRIIGEVLANRYRIEQRLGEGAMGAVYRAKHVKVGRPFAVKVLHPRLLEDAKQLQRFEREAELAGRLRHPNVIGVVDVGETGDGLRYMVMDFAEGPDLCTLLGEAPFTAARVIHLTRQMLEGLYHAHEAGLIHRDFKPENVIVEHDTHGAEVVRIVDFGIAILREGGDSTGGPGRLTTNGLVLGTPHYMAPEQAVADPIDHRIDLFALGIIIYEMLSGTLPFDGSGAEVARANLLLDPPPIADRVPYLQVDPLLEAFARRLMAKKRDLRPANAKIARDLLDLIAKDRNAAAAALGIAPEQARIPHTTQDAQPVQRLTGEGTFPPPMREAVPERAANAALGAREQPQPPSPVASADERSGTTTSVGPARRRKAPIIAATIVGVAIVGAGVALMVGGKQSEPATATTATATTATATQSPTPPPSVPTAQQTAAAESTPPAPAAPEPATTPVPKLDTHPVKTSVKKTTKPVNKPVAKQPAASAPAATPPAASSPPATKVETKPTLTEAPPSVATAGSVERQYRVVGADLKAFEDAKGQGAAADLWSRYRLIRINECFPTQETLDRCARQLATLAADIKTKR